jgi:WD40 repeat protein
VLSLAYSPDGKTLASGSGKISAVYSPGGAPLGWCPWSGKTPAYWPEGLGDEPPVGVNRPGAVVGKWLASGREVLALEPGEIKLWDVATGQEQAAFYLPGPHPAGLPQVTEPLGGYTVVSVAFSPDGKTLASGSEIMLPPRGQVRGLGFSGPPPPGEIILWDVATGENQATLLGQISWVNCVVYSPDGKMLASGSAGGTVKVWNVATDREPAALQGHTDEVSCVAFSPDGQTLASGSYDKTIKLWDVQAGK